MGMPWLNLNGWHAGAVEIPWRSRPGRRVAAVAAMAAAMLTAGCGGPAEPDRIGATGIDELMIPTPTPRAADFADTIDNPFLPFVPGTVWVYESNRGTTVTITATAQTKLIQGVQTTVVHEEIRDNSGERTAFKSRWFAQDQRGNVWNFGVAAELGSWEAGVGGARAGLAMAAIPRVGDGYLQGLLAGVAEDKATVVALDGEVSVPLGDFQDVVVIDETSDLRPGDVDQQWYAEDLGLIQRELDDGGLMELVSHSHPAP